jgi:hypothetical protein
MKTVLFGANDITFESRLKLIITTVFPESEASFSDESLKMAARLPVPDPVGSMTLNVADETHTNSSAFAKKLKQRGLSGAHLFCSEANSEVPGYTVDEHQVKFTAPIRDPRHALISSLHYEDKLISDYSFQSRVRGCSDSYFSMSLLHRFEQTQIPPVCQLES